MQISITQGTKDSRSINLFWGRELPGDVDAPTFDAGTLVLAYPVAVRPTVMDDWQLYETIINDKHCFVMWMVAATLSELHSALQGLAMELDMYPWFASYLPESFEELIWLKDGQYVMHKDGELYQVRLGLRPDDTWGVVLDKVVRNIPFPNDAFHRELALRCLYGHNRLQTGKEIVFHNPIRRITVRANPVVVEAGEIVMMKDHQIDVVIMDHTQVQIIQGEKARMDAEWAENPYLLACNTVEAQLAPFIWARPWQSERMRTENWRLPQGVYNLGEDEYGEVLLLALGYWPEAGDTIEMTAPTSLREYLEEPVGDGTRLEAINRTLDFLLVVKATGQ
jgi:hypothetical protein